MLGLSVIAVLILIIANFISVYALKKERSAAEQKLQDKMDELEYVKDSLIVNNVNVSAEIFSDLNLLEENMNHSLAHFRETSNKYFANANQALDQERAKWKKERHLFENVTRNKVKKKKIRRKRRKAA